MSLLLGLLASPVGCSTTIHPPEAGEGAVAVALVDHGAHASLMLPDEGGQMTRWAYGERKWYAQQKTGVVRALPALLWPTQAVLGRKHLPGPISGHNIRRRVGVVIETVWIIRVQQSQARTLHRNLDDLYRRHIDTQLINETYDLRFVDHPEGYSYFHNSNHMVAHWLRRLGCQVDGPTFHSTWRVMGRSESRQAGSSQKKQHAPIRITNDMAAQGQRVIIDSAVEANE